jgi:hypothetical protein
MTDGCFLSNQNLIRYARKMNRRLSVERKRGIRMVKVVIKVSIAVIIGNFYETSQAGRSRMAQVVTPARTIHIYQFVVFPIDLPYYWK